MKHKTAQKLFFRVFIILAFTSATTRAHQCSNFCSICFGQNSCGGCYKRKRIPNGRGGFCDPQPFPSTNHCLLTKRNSCTRCEPGWGLIRGQGRNLGHSCVKGTIQGCYNEKVYGSQHLCIECLGGYPDQGHMRCIPASQFQNPIPNCKIGSLNEFTGGIVCIQCQAGYTSDFYSCFKTPSSLEGCLLANKMHKSCARCDYANGYFERDFTKCSRNTKQFLDSCGV